MENRNDARFIATIQMPLIPATSVQAVLSVNGSLRKIVREMRFLETSYQDAIREFQVRYVVAVLVKHACHLGRAAEDLGMHRNTLTRIIRKLEIDPKQIRRLMRGRAIDWVPTSCDYSVCRHRDERVKWNSGSKEPHPRIGARAGA
jgi:predicted HTH domain antitoxin